MGTFKIRQDILSASKSVEANKVAHTFIYWILIEVVTFDISGTRLQIFPILGGPLERARLLGDSSALAPGDI